MVFGNHVRHFHQKEKKNKPVVVVEDESLTKDVKKKSKKVRTRLFAVVN